MEAEDVSHEIVDSAYHLHRDLGPGMLESVYELLLARSLESRGLRVERQKTIDFEFQGVHFTEGFRVDLLIEGCVVVELKSIDFLVPAHTKQVLTYLRLMHLSLGLLINFGSPTFREGIKRVVNGHTALGSSRLRVNQME